MTAREKANEHLFVCAIFLELGCSLVVAMEALKALGLEDANVSGSDEHDQRSLTKVANENGINLTGFTIETRRSVFGELIAVES